MKSNVTLKFLACLALACLVGCNESDSVSEDENVPPLIEGFIMTSSESFIDTPSLMKQVSLTVNAFDLDGNITNYRWAIVSGQNIQLAGAETSTVNFEFPLISSEQQDLVIVEATVVDNNNSEVTALYQQDINDYLTVIIDDIEVQSGEQTDLIATILGRESKISTLNWTVDATLDIILLDAETKNVSFIAPEVTEITELFFTLAITNINGVVSYHGGKVTVLPK